MNKKDLAIWGSLCMALPQQTSKWHYEGRTFDAIQAIKKISSLAKKHRMRCEWLCNGCKYNYYLSPNIPKEMLYDQDQFGTDAARIAFIDIEKIENKIKEIAKNFGFIIEHQYDPRGATIKLLYNDTYIKNLTEILYI